MLAQVDGFRRALTSAAHGQRTRRSAAIRGSYEGVIRQLEADLHEYDQLKSGKLKLPRLERLNQVAPLITKFRIAKGLSETELARRIGISKQVISRYEQSDYQTVATARLQEILEAIGIKTVIRLGW